MQKRSSYLESLAKAGLRAFLPAAALDAWRAFRSSFSEVIPRNTIHIYGEPRSAGFHWGAECSLEALPDSATRGEQWQSERGRKILYETSLLCTCLNEANTGEAWLTSLLSQEVLPAEVVIVDGGSSDGTLDTLQAFLSAWEREHGALRCRFSMHQEFGANIARGRNIAAAKATGRILLFADLGCCYDPAWVSCLLYPFLQSPDLEVSMGWYRVVSRSKFARAVARFIVPQAERIDLPCFLPSARSLALTRESFERAGKFPELLTKAGEDSLFDLELKKTTQYLAFVPQALVAWSMPGSLQQLWCTIVGYAQGDAEGGKLAFVHYWALLKKVNTLLLLVVLTLSFAALYIFTTQETRGAELGLFALTLGAAALSLRQAVNLLLPYQPAGYSRSIVEQVRGVFAVIFVVSAQCFGFAKGLSKRFRHPERFQ